MNPIIFLPATKSRIISFVGFKKPIKLMSELITFKDFVKLFLDFLKKYFLYFIIASIVFGGLVFFIRSNQEPYYKSQINGFSYVVGTNNLDYHLAQVSVLIKEKRYGDLQDRYYIPTDISKKVRGIEEKVTVKTNTSGNYGFKREEFALTVMVNSDSIAVAFAKALVNGLSQTKSVEREHKALLKKLDRLGKIGAEYETRTTSLDELKELTQAQILSSEMAYLSEFSSPIYIIDPVFTLSKDLRRVIPFSLTGALVGGVLVLLVCFLIDLIRS